MGVFVSKRRLKEATSPPTRIRRGSVEVMVYSGIRWVGDAEYPIHTIAYYEADGSRRRKTFAERTEALREAELVAAKLAAGQGEVLTLTQLDRAQYLKAAELLRPLKVSLLEAVSEFVASRSQLPDGVTFKTCTDFYRSRHPSTLKPKSVSALVDEYLADRTASGCSTVYLHDLRVRLNRFADRCRVPVASINGELVRTYLNSLKSSSGAVLGPRSRRNYLRVIAGLLRFGVAKRHYPAALLTEEIETIRPPKAVSGDIQIFTAAELTRILAATDSTLLPALAILAFAGLRNAEVSRLDWREIHLDEDFIEVKASKAKTGSRRIVPILPNLNRWLTPFVKKEGLLITTDRFDRVLDRLAQSAGVKWKHNGLRHAWISYRCALVKDPARVAYEAGNSPQMIFAHYHKARPESEAKQWFSLLPTTVPDAGSATKTS